MAVTFTPEQQRVIDLRGCNILVSAAAGSGKTAVLVERIVSRVCDEAHPVDIDRLLIVTFTNAAAAEMRERIAAGIAARLERQPDSEHIQRQAALLHNAQITTIDSFCLFLLRNHFNEIGLDPAFRIADEGEVRLMQEEALAELLEDSYLSGGETFRECVEFFCPGGRESVLQQHILNLSRYASGFPWPGEWLEERRNDYAAETVAELAESRCGIWLTGHLRAMAAGWKEKLERVRRICEEPDGPYMYGEMVDGELEQLTRLAGCESLEAYAAYLPAVTFGRLSSKKDESVSPVKRELAASLRAELKKSIKGFADRFFATPPELLAGQSAACRQPVCTLLELAIAFERRMAEKKRDRKVIDFNDMEHFALEILLKRENGEVKPGGVALEYREHFEEILIDEYQDSNFVQEYLLEAVSGEQSGRFNRFMVGDVKQSIYKFRLARPELFLEKYHSYTAGEGDRQRIDLARNFRSRREVVDAVNDVFSRIMSEQIGGVCYDERAALYPGAVYPESGGNESELLLIGKPSEASGLSERQLEARAVAAKIRQLKGTFRVTDKSDGELRPVRYSDMVILLRTNSGWDEVFQEELEKEGIPVYITSKTGYFSATEVQELLQLLRVLDNPRQDIPLFGVMKSLFGGFSEEEIALIRSRSRRGCLYEALEKFAADGGAEAVGDAADGAEAADGGAEAVRAEETDGAEAAADGQDGGSGLRGKTAVFLERLCKYRHLTVYLPVRELLTRLITDFDYLNYVTALPAGEKRRANVEMLLTRASDFEKTSYFGLFHFIRYMEQLEKYDVDYGEAGMSDENADVVRILSIHKSKGLEFPVTFVAGLSKRFNMQDVNRSLILDMDLGLGTDYVDPKKRIRNRTLRRNVIAEKLKEESLSEELRVLYVAMTRAREKLILTATLENAAEKWETAETGGRLLYSDFIESSCYLDFLMPVLKDTRIRVSLWDEAMLAAEALEDRLASAGRERLLELSSEHCDREALAKLRGRLAERYAFGKLAGLYTKTTVSELKLAAMADQDEAAYHAFEEKEVQPYIPTFRRGEEAVSGTVRGNAYHRVMELLDFNALYGALGGEGREGYESYREVFCSPAAEEELRLFLEKEVQEKRLKREYADAVNVGKLRRFLESELAWRMLLAQRTGRLYREQPFVMGISAARLGENFPETETVLIQGIIDAFFEEDDGIVLLDYKTDAVSSMQELWKRYETQLDYYSEALTKLKGKPVREKLLYSFRLERY